MERAALERYRNRHGQHGARLSTTAAAESPNDFGWTISILSLLTFGAPKSYHQVLQRWRESRDSTGSRWEPVVTTLLNEWNDIILYVSCSPSPQTMMRPPSNVTSPQATVLLSANVGFLAIPALSTPAAQILSLASMISSLGCIIIGLLLVRLHRRQMSLESSDHPVCLTSSSASPYDTPTPYSSETQ
jgi:hypothetical protein